MPQLVRSLEREVGGVSSVSASGNPFQPTLFYRGFAASPLQGTPQGLAVYVNGMRFNQPFGDTVYWDLIPDVAIDRVNVRAPIPSSASMPSAARSTSRLKDGFSFQGVEAAVAGGSFGQCPGGVPVRAVRAKALRRMSRAAPFTRTAGATCSRPTSRTCSPTSAGRARGPSSISTSPRLNSGLNGPGTAPVQLLAVVPSAQFTAPNWIANTYAAANLSANIEVGDTLSLQALGYYRYFRQSVINGNAPNDTPCRDDDNAGLLCFSGGLSTTSGRRIHQRLPGRRAIRPARHPEHQHACLRRQPAAHRHGQAARPRQSPCRRGEPGTPDGRSSARRRTSAA